MSESREHPVETLWRLQQEAVAAGHALPEQDRDSKEWGGLAFGVGDLYLVAGLTSIVDVLDCPAVTPVPGTRAWVMGVCNVRGRLLSVVDLGTFLGVTPRGAAGDGRILVINDGDLGCTLFVSRVYGLRYFRDNQSGQGNSGLHEAILPYADRSYVEEGRTWAVLSTERLISDERFLNVGKNA